MYIQCKPKDVQSLQSSYFLVFYHFDFETTTLTFSRIIDFDDATNPFLKQVYSCAVVDPCLIWTDLIVLISRPVRSLIKIIPQTQFSYRRGLTGMAYRSSSRDLINLHIETKY